MFIEIHQDHWINLAGATEIKPAGDLCIFIDGEIYEYDTEEDRELMLGRIREKLDPKLLEDFHVGAIRGTV